MQRSYIKEGLLDAVSRHYITVVAHVHMHVVLNYTVAKLHGCYG